MVNYFLNAFFSAFHKAAHNFPIKRTIPVRNWDGTSIQDHLTEADWKSIDREMTKQIENRNDRGVATVMCSLVEDRLKWLFERKCIDGLSK